MNSRCVAFARAPTRITIRVMLNASGVLAVLDHHLTINWDDGPTLHKISAAVRYHRANETNTQVLRVGASQRCSDEPLAFIVARDGVRATWIWREVEAGWCAQLVVVNEDSEEIYVDSLDVLRVEYGFGGLFNVGAPPGLWRCARELVGNEAGEQMVASASAQPLFGESLEWEDWGASIGDALGFARRRGLLLQPTMSNRSRPPALMVRALSGAALPVEIRLETTAERFDRFLARNRTDGLRLGGGVSLASSEFWVVCGDDANELARLPEPQPAPDSQADQPSPPTALPPAHA